MNGIKMARRVRNVGIKIGCNKARQE
jgi:hypothetical protein